MFKWLIPQNALTCGYVVKHGMLYNSVLYFDPINVC